jgi:hypothetical protein
MEVYIWAKTCIGFLQALFAKLTRELLRLNMNELREVAGQCHLKGHLYKMELINYPTSKNVQTKRNTLTCCNCNALAELMQSRGIKSALYYSNCSSAGGLTQKGMHSGSWAVMSLRFVYLTMLSVAQTIWRRKITNETINSTNMEGSAHGPTFVWRDCGNHEPYQSL